MNDFVLYFFFFFNAGALLFLYNIGLVGLAWFGSDGTWRGVLAGLFDTYWVDWLGLVTLALGMDAI